MALLRSVSSTDALFLFSVGLLWASVIAYWADRNRTGRHLGTVGWIAFALFWATVASGYLLESRYFLGSIGAVTVAVSAYVGSLVARTGGSPLDVDPPGELVVEDITVRVTFAFAIMGALFSVFEYVDPIHAMVLQAVATHTAWGLEVAGFSPVLGTGPQGYVNVVYFSGMSSSHAVSLVSACSGISAMTLFAGLVAATDASARRKVLTAVSVVGLIYVLNVFRALFVSGALAGRWFTFARGVVGAVFGITDPAMASYYFAEYLIAQVLVVVVLLGVYSALVRRFPEAQALVGGLLDSAKSDVDAVLSR